MGEMTDNIVMLRDTPSSQSPQAGECAKVYRRSELEKKQAHFWCFYCFPYQCLQAQCCCCCEYPLYQVWAWCEFVAYFGVLWLTKGDVWQTWAPVMVIPAAVDYGIIQQYSNSVPSDCNPGVLESQQESRGQKFLELPLSNFEMFADDFLFQRECCGCCSSG